ncbi:MAG: GNAT family N-acetyltransferase [Anaerolineae bacterium]|nr:GNAT family N-acetyltransferase [Anaerolineae bacterium]
MTIIGEQPDHSGSRDIASGFETARLWLRRYRLEDASWYAPMSMQNRDHLARYESGNAAMGITTEADAAAVIQGFIESWNARSAFFLGAFRKESGVFVAQIYIGVVNWDLPELELGYFAAVAHTGQGFVTEAAQGALHFCFRELGAHRVRLECDDTNIASYRVAERCGMIREGHLRENHRHADGTLTGTLLYGLLSHEFDS